MFKRILRGLLPASVGVCLLVFAIGCSSTQGGYGTGRDTTGMGGTYGGGTVGGDQGTTTPGNQGGTTTGSGQGTMNPQGSMSSMSSMASGAGATVLAKLLGADSSEIAVSQYALDRLSDPRVKQYAQMLINDHQKDQSQTKSLASQLNITPTPPSTDSTATHTDNALSMLKAADKGQSFDSAFLQMQINDHQTTIDALKAAQSLVTNDQIKNHINDVLPTLQSHLTQAQDLLKNLGMSQTGH